MKKFFFIVLHAQLTVNNFILTKKFKSMKNFILISVVFRSNLMLFSFLLLSIITYGQTKEYSLTGKVLNSDQKQPIPGASVLIKNTDYGGVTDFDGNYEIKADLKPGEYTIEVSYLGYVTETKQLSLNNDTEIVNDFILKEDPLGLDEVIVTGSSGNTTRRKLGNSIGTIKSKEIANTGSENTLSALSGKILGAQVNQNSGNPGGGFSVSLRGVSTVFGSGEPLYIIDGVYVDNSSQNVINLNIASPGSDFQAGQNRLVDINPNDIERIEVLKGAAAAAIYGSLASNGVVQIFTKKGEKGEPRINYSNSTNLNFLRKRVKFTKFGQRFGFRGNERLSTTGDRLTMIADLRSADDRAANPGTGPAALAGRPLVKNTYAVDRFDYQDQIFRDAVGTENYFSISGANDKASYFLSTNYSRNQGIIDDTHFQRYGARFKIGQELFENFKISVGGNYSNSSSEDKPNGNSFFSPISTMFITDNVWDIEERDEFGNLRSVEPQRVNPLSVIEDFEITQETNRFIGNARIDYQPIEGLNFSHTFGLDTYTLVGNTLQRRLPYGPVASTFFPDGYVSVVTSKLFQTNNDFLATYTKDIGKFTSTTTAGFQYLFQESKSTSAEGRDLLDFIETINAAQNLFSNPREFRSKRSTWGYFLQETLGYDNWAYLTLAGRIDGSSVFGDDERNQFYPKISTSLILSALDFWNDSFLGDIFNSLKLRGSYGEAGNLTAIGPFDRFTNANPVILTGRGGFIPDTQLGVEDIKPEQNNEIEVGTDFSIFNNRTTVEFSYYNQNVEDLILPITVSPSSGGASTIANIGSLTNKGIEMKVSTKVFNDDNFKWNTTGLLSTFDNELDNIGGGRSGIALGRIQRAIDGQSVSAFFSTYFARNDDGSLLLTPEGLPQVERGDDVNGIPKRDANGQPIGTPLRKVLGDPNPDYTLTWVNEISYKKLSLRLQIDAVQGQDMFNTNRITGNNVGNGMLAEKELKGLVPRGYVAAVGGFIGPRIEEFMVEDASFIKLRELSINYDFGQWLWFKNFNINLIGRNIFSIDDYSGYDPETNSAGQSTAIRGDDFGNVPIPTTIQLKFNFSL